MPPNLAEKTFPNSHKTVIFVKVFSLKSSRYTVSRLSSSVSSACFLSLQQDDAAGIQGGDAGGDPYCQSHSEGLGPEDTGVRGGLRLRGKGRSNDYLQSITSPYFAMLMHVCWLDWCLAMTAVYDLSKT